MKHLSITAFQLFSLLVFPLTVFAATYTVTNTNDSGAGSLRRAVLDANNAPTDDVISFAIPANDTNCTTNAVCTIRLTSGELTVSASRTSGRLAVTNSTGASNLLIDGNKNRTDINEDRSRIFYVDNGADLSVEGVTVTNGAGSGRANGNFFFGYGGGILNAGGKTGYYCCLICTKILV